MKRILGAVIGGLLMTMASAHGAWAFGIKDVVGMHREGIADSLIEQKIAYSGTRFHLDAKDIRELKGAGISDAVISKMLKTEADEPQPVYAGPYWGPYDPYYRYDPYYYFYGPYYPRVSVGLRFGYHDGYRGGHRHWR